MQAILAQETDPKNAIPTGMELIVTYIVRIPAKVTALGMERYCAAVIGMDQVVTNIVPVMIAAL